MELRKPRPLTAHQKTRAVSVPVTTIPAYETREGRLITVLGLEHCMRLTTGQATPLDPLINRIHSTQLVQESVHHITIKALTALTDKGDLPLGLSPITLWSPTRLVVHHYAGLLIHHPPQALVDIPATADMTAIGGRHVWMALRELWTNHHTYNLDPDVLGDLRLPVNIAHGGTDQGVSQLFHDLNFTPGREKVKPAASE